MLVRHGYGVLLLDARGYDGSEGDPNVFGWDARRTSMRLLPGCRQPDVRDGRIGGIGFSVGGEMMLKPLRTIPVCAQSSPKAPAYARSARI